MPFLCLYVQLEVILNVSSITCIWKPKFMDEHMSMDDIIESWKEFRASLDSQPLISHFLHNLVALLL